MPTTPRRVRRSAFLATVATLLGALSGAVPVGSPARAAPPAPSAGGYWTVATDGGIFSFGSAPFHGSTGGIELNRPIVGMAATAGERAKGYWLVASDGGVFAFGDAAFHGSTGAVKLNRPIVGMAPTPTPAGTPRAPGGRGYWLIASDGGVFAFGDAAFHGSTGAVKLNRPIVGMAPSPTGRGYWLVASDGGVFAFGDAAFHGSGQPSGQAFAGMAATPSGRGYWLVTTTGQVLAFGDAADHGSAASGAPVVGLSATDTGRGYWVVAGDGAVFAFGDARDYGSTAGRRLNQPMVGFAAAAAPVADPGAETTTPTAPGEAGTTPTTRPAASPGPSPGPERFSPIESPSSGGTSTADLPTTGTDCGFPSSPTTTANPEAENIGEASGMTASTRYPGVYWVIRDGANPPRNEVYAVRIGGDGVPRSRAIPVPGAFNGDWEEVSYAVGADGRGRLWVVESGQMTRTGQYRQVYEIAEPDPDTATSAELLNTFEYALPDGRNHNIEASMMHRGYLVLVGKVSPHAPVFIFDTLVAGRTNVPTYLGTLGSSKDVSVIRRSPDGTLLVTASHQVVHMYRSTDGSGSLRSFIGRQPDCELRAFPDENVEAGEWSSNREMLFLDELKKTHRLAVEP